jgi:hypothetical protein
MMLVRAAGLLLMARRGEFHHRVPYKSQTLTSSRSELKPGDYVTISTSRFPFPTVLPLDRKGEDWVDSISRTLNWNNRQRQKAFDDQKKSDA